MGQFAILDIISNVERVSNYQVDLYIAILLNKNSNIEYQYHFIALGLFSIFICCF